MALFRIQEGLIPAVVSPFPIDDILGKPSKKEINNNAGHEWELCHQAPIKSGSLYHHHQL